MERDPALADNLQERMSNIKSAFGKHLLSRKFEELHQANPSERTGGIRERFQERKARFHKLHGLNKPVELNQPLDVSALQENK